MLDAVMLTGTQWWAVLGLSLTVPLVIEYAKLTQQAAGARPDCPAGWTVGRALLL
jgi:hypothetical protein